MVRLLHYVKAGDEAKVAEIVDEYSGHPSVKPLLAAFKDCNHEGAISIPSDMCTIMWADIAYSKAMCAHNHRGTWAVCTYRRL